MKLSLLPTLFLFASLSACAVDSTSEPVASTDDALGSCTGVKVPGDYATIQEAVDAGNPSVCIAAGTFAEHVQIRAATTELHGAGRDKTHIQELRVYESTAEISDLAVDQGLIADHNDHFAARHCVMRDDSLEAARAVEIAGRKGLIELEDNDISAPHGTALFVYFPTEQSWPSGQLQLSIHDNVIHDGSKGIDARFERRQGTLAVPEWVHIDRNVIRGFSDAALTVQLDWCSAPFAVSYTKNRIESSALGVVLYGGGADVTHSGNVLSGNVTNYAGQARPD